jgi:hypothetical protein
MPFTPPAPDRAGMPHFSQEMRESFPAGVAKTLFTTWVKPDNLLIHFRLPVARPIVLN